MPKPLLCCVMQECQQRPANLRKQTCSHTFGNGQDQDMSVVGSDFVTCILTVKKRRRLRFLCRVAEARGKGRVGM